MPRSSVSIIVPIYNEAENLLPLYRELATVMTEMGRPCELLFVDDGSIDNSPFILMGLANRDPRVRVVTLRRNSGQTAALSAGIDMARGDVIVTLDGDLQNDPEDIPRMVDELAKGYDLVHGWRRIRHDTLITRRIPSRIANWLIEKVTGVPVHDLGCTLKAIRSDTAKELRLYGELHRFIPILAAWQGARLREVITHHRPRIAGQSKYGLGRTIRVLLDLITVKFLLQYSVRPMQLFGGLGLGLMGASLASLLGTLVMKYGYGVDMTGNPLLLLSACGGIASVQFLMLGLLAEMGMRTYHESQGRRPYQIGRLTNFEDSTLPSSQGTSSLPANLRVYFQRLSDDWPPRDQREAG